MYSYRDSGYKGLEITSSYSNAITELPPGQCQATVSYSLLALQNALDRRDFNLIIIQLDHVLDCLE